jgi:hypothetical protein
MGAGTRSAEDAEFVAVTDEAAGGFGSGIADPVSPCAVAGAGWLFVSGCNWTLSPSIDRG